MRSVKVTIVMIFIVTMVFLTACNENESLEPLNENEQITLRVLTDHYDQNLFEERIGKFFEFDYPNIKVKILPLREISPDQLMGSEVEQILQEHNIDLIIMDDNQYGRLSGLGLLYSLEAIANAEFATEELLEPAIDFLREKGRGELRGLAPRFDSSALYYNQDLFDELRVPYPENYMSWEELFNLASQFTGHERNGEPIYGFTEFIYDDNVFDLIMNVASAEELSLFNATGSELLINSAEWLKVSNAVLEAYQSGTIYRHQFKEGENPLDFSKVHDVFLEGRAAMMTERPSFMEDLVDVEFNWSYTTQPVHSVDRNKANYFIVDEIYSIYAGSSNTRAAWELIKLVHSEKMMRQLYGGYFHGIPTRVELAEERYGYDMSLFHTFDVDVSQSLAHPDVEQENFNEIMAIIGERFDQVFRGEIGVEEAHALIEQEGNGILHAGR